MERISAALVKAQKQFGPALKTSTNPHFRSRYADLSACVEAVIDALNANGIALIQRTLPGEGVNVETVFIHESGEQISSGPLHVPAAKNDPQGYGSALTYARRYSLMAACGIAPEDDDGNAASKPKKKDAGGVIKATDGALESLPADERDYIKELAADITAMTHPDAMVEAIEAAQLENEQKVALWSLLPSNIRSAIKKEQERKQAA